MLSFRVVWPRGSARPGSRPFICLTCPTAIAPQTLSSMRSRSVNNICSSPRMRISSTHSISRINRTKLLLVSTGNISNVDLQARFAANTKAISDGFLTHDFIEINRNTVIFHSRDNPSARWSNVREIVLLRVFQLFNLLTDIINRGRIRSHLSVLFVVLPRLFRLPQFRVGVCQIRVSHSALGVDLDRFAKPSDRLVILLELE